VDDAIGFILITGRAGLFTLDLESEGQCSIVSEARMYKI